jgi:hypothetical protein
VADLLIGPSAGAGTGNGNLGEAGALSTKRARNETTASAPPTPRQQVVAAAAAAVVANAATIAKPVQHPELQPAAAAPPPPASGSTAAAVTVAAPATTASPPTLPELQLLPDGNLDLVCESLVAAALVKVLHWLGALPQASKQLWLRYYEWLDGGVGGTRAFVRAYNQLHTAVLSADREYVAAVLGDAWGVAL